MQALTYLRSIEQALADLVERRSLPVRADYGELLDRMIAILEAEIDIRAAFRSGRERPNFA